MPSTAVQEETPAPRSYEFINLYVCGRCAFCQALQQVLEEMQSNGQVNDVDIHYVEHRTSDTGQDDHCAPTVATSWGNYEDTAEIHLYLLNGCGYHISPEGEIRRDQTKKEAPAEGGSPDD